MALYRRYSRPIQAYCARRTTPPKVADAVADTFAVAWRRIGDVPEGDGALPWLYGVAYRVLSHQWRQRDRGERLLQRLRGLGETGEPDPEVYVIRNEEYREVIQAAARLRPLDQEVLRLILWEELSLSDAAAVLGLTPAALKQRAYRARRSLAEEYQKLNRDRQPPAARRGGES